ncbi:MAG TPA: hypothetical protein PLC89_12600 [Haliscomenobacter sp.]|uniref:hypothetical protein n=1 Tax=Haliscomenobacter sp. TaxID=2717303 RepID=UPI002C187B8F|nr:hypothetical protein [Haliscomenobacter sp.]HOY18136.1 hypothetical protein [Haliscomenobacter sp.]
MKNYLLTLGILVIIQGCAQLNYLDQAQNAFNQGATLESNRNFGEQPNLEQPFAAGSQAMSFATPDLCYQLAYAQVNKALEKESKLKADGVLANAQALRALSAWKLGLYQQASESALAAKIALQDSDVALPRESAMMTALEGLIQADQAYAAVQKFKLENQSRSTTPNASEALSMMENVKKQYEENIVNFSGTGRIEKSLAVLDQAKKEIPERADIQTYFIMSQLAALKSWLDNLDQIYSLLKTFGFANTNNDLKRWFDQENERYAQKRNQYMAQLAPLLPQQKENVLYKRWEEWLYN